MSATIVVAFTNLKCIKKGKVEVFRWLEGRDVGKIMAFAFGDEDMGRLDVGSIRCDCK